MIEVFPSSCRELDLLKPAVEQTFAIIDAFVAQFAETSRIQIPYGTNERATLSLFTGGIWRSQPSNLALEEYTCTKGTAGGTWKGRRDLWFKIDGQACFAEAKQEDWPCAATFTDVGATVCLRRALSEADDARRDSENSTLLEMYPGEPSTLPSCSETLRCFGIAFVVPFLYQQERHDNEAIMDEYARKLRTAAQRITQERDCRVMWGRYYRRDMVEPTKFFKSLWKRTWLAMPELDILICEAANEEERAALKTIA